MRTRDFRQLRITTAALAAALALSACGGGDDPTISSGSGSEGGSVQASPVAGIDAEHNDADIMFITMMKPHHEGALEMAELADTRAESPAVKALADKIMAAQDPEIEMMNKMATAWGVDLEAEAAEGGAGHSMSSGDDTAALEPLTGKEFDREFLTRMIAHHEGAIEMAETELADGVNPQAKQMAADITESQAAEIEEMKALLAAA
jgi:uncharacterized protein (DUF305 family)